MGKEMRVRGGGGAGEIPAISHYPVRTKREEFNNYKDKHYEIKTSWPEARQYDTIPETRSASDLRTCPTEILHDGSRQTRCSHQMNKPLSIKLAKTHCCNSPQAERHLVLPIANAGARPAAHFALARALRGAARSFRAVCNMTKSFHCQGIVKYGSKVTGLPLNSENKSP